MARKKAQVEAVVSDENKAQAEAVETAVTDAVVLDPEAGELAAPESDGVEVAPSGEGAELQEAEVDEPAAAEAGAAEASAEVDSHGPDMLAGQALDHVFIDLGRQGKKKLRKLKDFRGPLMDEVEIAIQNLQAEGHLDPKVQTVIVLVRGK